MKKLLLLAALGVLLVVPAAFASGHDMTGSYSTVNASSGRVSLIYVWSGFPGSGAYQMHDDVTCDNGFVGGDTIAAYGAQSALDTFVTGGPTNCSAVLTYTHTNKPVAVFLDSINFTVPA